MYCDRIIAQQLEAANAASHRAYTGRTEDYLSLSTGGAYFSGPDSFFSQVVGWGFGSAWQGEVERIEDFYRQRGCAQVGIEIASLASLEACNALMERGYRLAECSNVSLCADLKPFAALASPVSSSEEVRLCRPDERQAWAQTVAGAFGIPGHQGDFERYAGLASVFAFGAQVGGVWAGGGTIALHAGVADLGLTATLPHFRGQGIQKKLLQARLAFAAGQGARMAVVYTTPGSVSDNNVRKSGFATVYTRLKFEKGL